MIRRLIRVCLAVLIAIPLLAPPAGADEATTTPVVVAEPTMTMTGPTWSIQNCDGRWEQFRYANDASAEHRWHVSPDGWVWSGWNSLGGTLLYGDIGGGRNSDCRIEVFGVGTDQGLWTTWQTNPGAGPWMGWHSLGGILTSAPTAYRFPDGTLGVCALGADTPPNTWCIKHIGLGPTPWSDWFIG